MCHGCKEPGHIRRNCPNPPIPPTTSASRAVPASNSYQSLQPTNQGPRTNILREETIRPNLDKKIKLNNVYVNYMLDTGAEVTAISPEIYNKLSLSSIAVMEPYRYPHARMANGGTAEIMGSVLVVLELGDYACETTLIVVKDLAVDCLLGLDVVQSHPKMGRLLRRLERLQGNSETTSSSESDDDRRSKNEWIRMSTPVAKANMNTPPRKGSMILEESIATLGDYWYLDELFADEISVGMLPTNQSIEHKLEASGINVIEAGILQTASPKLNMMNLGKSIEHNQQQRRNLIQIPRPNFKLVTTGILKKKI